MKNKFNVGEAVTIKGNVIAVQSINSNSASPDYYYQIEIGDNMAFQIHERFVHKNIKLDNAKIHDAKQYKENHWK